MVYIANPTAFTVDSVDWAPHVKAIELTGDEEIVDARTFSTPRATTTGGGQDSVSIMVLWTDEFHKLFDAASGSDVAMSLAVDGGAWGATIHVPSSDPKPSYTIGEMVEVALVCGVTDALVYTPSP